MSENPNLRDVVEEEHFEEGSNRNNVAR